MKVDKRKLPEGWKLVKLGEVITFIKGKVPNKLSNIQEHSMVIYLSPEYLRGNINETFFCSVKNVILADNDIIILFDGSNAGEIFFAEKGAIASTMAKVDIQTKFIHKIFLYYVLKSYERLIKSQIKGSGIPHVEKNIFELLFAPLPPLPEQRKIAEILETIDIAIEKTDAIIEKYKRIKQGLMQDLLTKGVVSEGEGESERWRLRDENIDKFKDSPLGRIPEEWKIRKLDHREITIMITDGSHYSPQPVENSEYYIVNIENIINGKIEFETCKKISPKDYKKLVSNKCNPKYRDVLFTKDGTVGITLVFSGERNVVLLSSIAIIRPSNCLDSSYLKYSLETEQIKKQIDILIGGSVLKRIVLKDIKSLLIFIPPLPEQQRVASILSQIDEVIEKEQAYKEKLERIKKGLMEDLLTGKVRVNHLIEEE
ncbi:restriction endonuclease subunit S [Fervidobacterium islandicum]|uniref:Restriction endonuclease subunit S n=1 Tax=Fervidobacterium islandicum TaxID=2423 RepID=A0AAI8CK28_FERIS|nr:restriction endonuclease subunit S [Fervidobacterium islandicum]AMW32383.1 restriction endonuclease subunit S [Fervidobacterium islandicum]